MVVSSFLQGLFVVNEEIIVVLGNDACSAPSTIRGHIMDDMP
jgi:hypothetical protein